jgi:hypothetical protein
MQRGGPLSAVEHGQVFVFKTRLRRGFRLNARYPKMYRGAVEVMTGGRSSAIVIRILANGICGIPTLRLLKGNITPVAAWIAQVAALALIRGGLAFDLPRPAPTTSVPPMGKARIVRRPSAAGSSLASSSATEGEGRSRGFDQYSGKTWSQRQPSRPG